MPEKKNDAILFAALKLIEALHARDLVPDYMFKNILNEYANRVDTTQFKIKTTEQKGE